MDKNDILDYVTETPGNTNRAVLGSMLDSIGGESGNMLIGNLFKNANDKYTIDMTFKQVEDTIQNGKLLFFIEKATADNDFTSIVALVGSTQRDDSYHDYAVQLYGAINSELYAESEDDYPVEN